MSLVCGAGPAGVVAAIVAAREGTRTRLIELHGCLGGVWITGTLSWIIDSVNKPGVMAEITSRLDARDARRTRVEGGKNYA
jgi:thioredoxin reductase